MSEWILWFITAGVTIILELFTGTFYLLMIGLGLAVGGIAALAGAEGIVQLLVAAIVGMLATTSLRRIKAGREGKVDAARDPNVNLDIGQQISVDAWHGSGGRNTARVPYRGAMWDVELQSGTDPHPGLFIIREIRGSRLIVGNNRADSN
ncbi:NfeD family protein [Noviherbaspirillum massiliense]|uniref:NfeD family protein n=1 Tax=Noviherbaspirillum massiliense TaxID=1465823 RepID=UPI0002D68E51|nr:hypothetical protein [Noviherbaspirillum massiliense]